MDVIDDAVVSSLFPFHDPSFVFCPSTGRSGGILLVWNSTLWQMVDAYVGSILVSVLVKDVHTHVEWVATSVCGPNQSSDRSAFWAELSSIAGRWQHSWVIGGDFNIIRFSSEKGGCRVSADMMSFFDWIRQYEMIDLPLGGARYTWTSCEDNPVMSRLDRFLISLRWAELYPDCIQRVLSRPTFDHCSISLETGLEDWGPPSFQLELMWFKEKTFLEGISTWWTELVIDGWMGFQPFQTLKALRKRINIWKKE